jgi:3D-(3,5/4)-trihydroxycyclohexane-1,2-dione acylhydrolase (decyclizing)
MAQGMGAKAQRVADLHELRTAMAAVQGEPGVHVIVVPVAQHRWSEGGSFWEVGVPEVSDRPAVDQARADVLAGKQRQRW